MPNKCLKSRGVHLTQKPDPPASPAQTWIANPPKLTTLAISYGSPSTEPDTFWLVGEFPHQKPELPYPIIKSKKFGDIQRFSNKNLQKPTIFEIFRQRITWNPSDPTRSHQDLVKIQLDLVEIWPNLDRFNQISARSQRIRPNIITNDKTRNRPIQPETWRDPNRMIRLVF